MSNILEAVPTSPDNKVTAASLASDLIVAQNIVNTHNGQKKEAAEQVSLRLLDMHARVIAARAVYEEDEWNETVAPALHGHLEQAQMKHHSRKRLINWSIKAYEMKPGLAAAATDDNAVQAILAWFKANDVKTQAHIYALGYGKNEDTPAEKAAYAFLKLSKEEQEEARTIIAEALAAVEAEEAEKANAKANALANAAAERDADGETVAVEDGTNVPHPGLQWVAGIREHAAANYGMKTVAWDHIVEAWDDMDIAEEVAACTTLKGAIKKIGLILKTIREAEQEAVNA